MADHNVSDSSSEDADHAKIKYKSSVVKRKSINVREREVLRRKQLNDKEMSDNTDSDSSTEAFYSKRKYKSTKAKRKHVRIAAREREKLEKQLDDTLDYIVNIDEKRSHKDIDKTPEKDSVEEKNDKKLYAVDEVVDTFVNLFIDCVENLPESVIRHISQIKEYDCQSQRYLCSLSKMEELIANSPNLLSQKSMSEKLTSLLVTLRAIGDKKIELVLNIQDLIDDNKVQLNSLGLALEKYEKEKEKKVLDSPTEPSCSTPKTDVEKENSKKRGRRSKTSGSTAKQDILLDSQTPNKSKPTRRSTRQKLAVDEKESSSDESIPEWKYCYCKKDYPLLTMVECENKKCVLEWYHLKCLGLSSAPRGKWYCPECQGTTSSVMKGK